MVRQPHGDVAQYILAIVNKMLFTLFPMNINRILPSGESVVLKLYGLQKCYRQEESGLFSRNSGVPQKGGDYYPAAPAGGRGSIAGS